MSYSQVVLADSPILYHRDDESSGTTVADSSTGGNPGTLLGGFTLGQTGALRGDPDTAVLLNGTSGYVKVVDAASLRLTGDMTLEMWIKLTSLTQVCNPIFKGDAAETNAGPYAMDVSKNANGQIRASVGNGTTQANSTVTATTALSDSNWHLIGWTVSGTTLTHYLDGQPNGSGSIAGVTRSDLGQQLSIGAKGLTATRFVPGSIDEVAIYNKALSANQILAHWEAGLALLNPLPTPRNRPRLSVPRRGRRCDPPFPQDCLLRSSRRPGTASSARRSRRPDPPWDQTRPVAPTPARPKAASTLTRRGRGWPATSPQDTPPAKRRIPAVTPTRSHRHQADPPWLQQLAPTAPAWVPGRIGPRRILTGLAGRGRQVRPIIAAVIPPPVSNFSKLLVSRFLITFDDDD